MTDQTLKTATELICRPIGYIRTPFASAGETPKAGVVKPEVEGCIELFAEYAEAAASMKVGKRYVVLFWFHEAKGYAQTVHWRGYGALMGLFSTRSPHRPNPIGLSTITVTGIEPPKAEQADEPMRIWFTGVDMIDGTPVLDIKSTDVNEENRQP